MNTYFSSPISSVLYDEIEAIVNGILEHPKKYKTVRSIAPQLAELKAMQDGLGRHRTSGVIDELMHELQAYCRQGGDKRCGTVYIMKCLYALKCMAETERDEMDADERVDEEAWE